MLLRLCLHNRFHQHHAPNQVVQLQLLKVKPLWSLAPWVRVQFLWGLPPWVQLGLSVSHVRKELHRLLTMAIVRKGLLWLLTVRWVKRVMLRLVTKRRVGGVMLWLLKVVVRLAQLWEPSHHTTTCHQTPPSQPFTPAFSCATASARASCFCPPPVGKKV